MKCSKYMTYQLFKIKFKAKKLIYFFEKIETL